MADFEQPDKFYLGREYDLAAGERGEQRLLYDARDLTTHAVCVGMTGSGKTGLCLALLEEAALDGIPAIAIDPKGDLGNLLLAFPELRPADFRPWIDEDEAARRGIAPGELAAETAARWRSGLAEWDEAPERIAKYCAAVDRAIYTPGSTAGLPLSVLQSLAAPPRAILADADLLRDRIAAEASGLLALVGINADPINSREHILISRLLEEAWQQGHDLKLADLVRAIQDPPIRQVGSLDLDTFYPAKDRTELALRLNNLLASPGFAGWMEGEPLDVGRLLHTADGRPRLSILSIAHLDDAQRMFFVTILLNEVLAWVRGQSGTSSLRAILYMDEVFGYFPPTANPPSKKPMLTLLKQARAYGLGIVLATQNPVDLDYKGLSNAGTWFLGRLQTERDKARVLEGLEGASAAAGSTFDRGKMEATLAALGNRVFLLNNVHEDRPVVFQTRWCLSYLRGPLSRSQIQTLMADRKMADADGDEGDAAPAKNAAANVASDTGDGARGRPESPTIKQVFVQTQDAAKRYAVYRPALLGRATLHFVDATAGVDCSRDFKAVATVDGEVDDDFWKAANVTLASAAEFQTSDQPPAAAEFAPLVAALNDPRTYARAEKSLVEYLYRTRTLDLWQAPELDLFSRPEESQDDFRARAVGVARQACDKQLETLRAEYESRQAAIQKKIDRAEARAGRESSQFWRQVMQTAMSAVAAVLQIASSRKWTSQRNVSRTTSTARSAGRAAREREDVSRANEQLAELRAELAELTSRYHADVEAAKAAASEPRIEAYPVRPRKGDPSGERVVLAWMQ